MAIHLFTMKLNNTKDTIMKFKELSIMSKIKIAAELSNMITAGYHYIGTVHSDVDQEIAAAFKEHGLTFNRSLMNDLTDCNVKVVRPKTKKERQQFGQFTPPQRVDDAIRFYKVKDEVNLDFRSTFKDLIADELVFDRFSISGNIVVGEDTVASLKKTTAMLTAFRELWGGSTILVDTLNALLVGFEKAEKLPDSLWDSFKFKASLLNEFESIKRICTFSDFEYDEDTGQRRNLPAILTDSNMMEGLTTTYSSNNTSTPMVGHGITVNYTETLGEDTGTVTINSRASRNSHIELTTKEVDVNANLDDFIDVIKAALVDARKSDKWQPMLEPLMAHTETLLEMNRLYIEKEVTDLASRFSHRPF